MKSKSGSPTKKARSKIRLGLSLQLLVLFLGAAGLTAGAAITARVSFQKLSDSLREVVTEGVPAIRDSLHLAAESNAVSALAAKLVAASNAEERKKLVTEITEREGRLDTLTQSFSSEGASADLNNSYRAFTENLRALKNSLDQRAKLEQQVDESLDRFLTAKEKLTNVSDTLLDEAGSNLLLAMRTEHADITETPALRKQLMRLVFQHTGKLQQLLEIQAGGDQLVGMVNEALGQTHAAALEEIRGRFTVLADDLRSRVGELGEEMEIGDLPSAIEALTGLIANELLVRKTLEVEERTRHDALVEESRSLAGTLNTLTSSLTASTEQDIESKSRAVETEIKASQRTLTILTIIAIVGSLLIAWLYVGRYLVSRIQALRLGMERLANGDTEVTIVSRGNDEITAMAATVEVFKQNAVRIQRMEEERKEAEKQTVMVATDGILSDTEQMAEAIDQTRIAVTQIAEGAHHQSSALEQIVGAVRDSSDQISTANTHTQDARTLSRTAAQMALQGNEKMSEVMAAVTTIARDSEQINKITEVITGIANQTNLLSLNAAIEAARAGEMGRGFAVVADEVRELAQHSAKSAEEIRELVERATQQAQRGVEVATQANTDIESIVSSATENNTMLESVATTIEQQRRSIEQLNNHVGEIQQISTSNATASEEISATMDTLVEQANDAREKIVQLRSSY